MSIDTFVKKVCVQRAVYWGNPVADGFGNFTFDEPVSIYCRWEIKSNVIKDSLGRELITKAKVLLTQDVEVQGWLYLGLLEDFEETTDLTNPKSISGAYEIIGFDKTPMIRSTTVYVREAYLV